MRSVRKGITPQMLTAVMYVSPVPVLRTLYLPLVLLSPQVTSTSPYVTLVRMVTLVLIVMTAHQATLVRKENVLHVSAAETLTSATLRVVIKRMASVKNVFITRTVTSVRNARMVSTATLRTQSSLNVNPAGVE